MTNITKVIMITVFTQSLSLGYSFLNATFSCDKQMHVCPRGDTCVCVCVMQVYIYRYLHADVCSTDVCIQMCICSACVYSADVCMYRCVCVTYSYFKITLTTMRVWSLVPV